ncbi:hypothetical protein COW36_14705 [bacterium (Candidatus Blackallbacteria) CG17_big_fil_post_rev_8_21_14_2_50_48_46]|uniref:Lipoprotein n=1 Tax=bacterium (Candidatus Blackallbacteria) CG17_big_fil_post_rev_8_21_14_2_50_48_46 TaxID=2014261 RepID=A0A2M7G2M3_9BACT|nr:MAG: hypothetical protein COW64_11845 [bacterium (Candidatus Blackallbacteria) CG18_big_fil_WC_8_21_14_2_50_49_26]PIW15965.1 MAG: hypothetical protein COW36_14705 [bacterium (Candidatus Blackallbacteria) CG17_big_fil_post_rev_8_21_14_2_50_48_46]PIW50377.1 MAG: hypothetical protein COW20_02420 [bacterium (Candidatus Blackallbacteria) CG13_big_fil_rev_8_21_14_2_50_49_14]
MPFHNPQNLKSALSILAVLSLLGLSACSQVPMPLVQTTENARVQVLSRKQATRPTIGTAKEVYAQAEIMAQRWSAHAEPVYLEGRFISSNGLNDAPIDAVWSFAFVSAQKPGKVFQVVSRSETTKLAAQELKQSTLSALEPLEVRAWSLDSSLMLQKARRVTEMIPYPVPKMVLSMNQDHRLVWKIPQLSPMPELNFDAMNGQVLETRR